MTHLAIIAGDLTGALDSAAPFAVCGLTTNVATRPEAVRQALAAECDVVTVSLKSRLLAADDAAWRAGGTGKALH